MAVVLLLLLAGTAMSDTASDVLALTGGRRARFVWARDTTPHANHPFGRALVYKLMGFDSIEGKEREILGAVSDYSHPRLNHDGTLVLYSNYLTNEVFVVNWDGSENRRIVSKARHGCFWHDPSAGKEYVIYQAGTDRNDPLRRIDVNNLSDDIELLKARATTIEWLSVSRDGTRLGGSFPWPANGIVRLSDGGYDGFGEGCWSSVTPDDAYTFSIFDGAHRNWLTWDADHGNHRVMVLNTGPGINGCEIYHPRYAANDAGFLTVNGPYSIGPADGNNIWNGGRQVELYFGKLDPPLTQVANWVRITSNDRADFFGHCWIEGCKMKAEDKKTAHKH